MSETYRGSRLALMIGVVFVLGVVGCTGDAEDQVADGGDVALEETPPPAMPETAAVPTMTDPQIAHAAVTANTIDIELAELAQSKSTNAEVRGFAETMITDHTAVNQRATELAGRLGVTPETNAVSESLQRDAETARSQLEALSGAAFDRAYIEREVGYHEGVLNALDQTLIPNTTNQELRALLTEVRPAFVAHLERARTLLTTLPAQ